jgi:hypothetical protein
MRGLCHTPLKSGLPLAVRGAGPVGAFVDRSSWPEAERGDNDNKTRAAAAAKIAGNKIFTSIPDPLLIRSTLSRNRCVERLCRDEPDVNPAAVNTLLPSHF